MPRPSRNHNPEILNPCLKEQNMTYDCLNRNNFDREACELQMENYKTCKGFWMSVQAERRQKGISPVLPPVEEREQIKKEYFEKLKR